MRPLLLTSTVLVGLALAGAAPAQEYKLPTDPPPNPRQVVPDQRLEVASQNMVYAAERLDKAAEQDDDKTVSLAINESKETVAQMREIFDDLPPEQQDYYQAALREADAALATGDPRVGAAAMRELRQKVLSQVAQPQ